MKRWTGFGVIVLMMAVGCGRSTTVKFPEPVEVSGKVTLPDGKPARDCIVLLQPVNSLAPASGRVGADGKFSLQTYDKKAGAIPGKYTVVIRPIQGGNKNETLKSREAMKEIPAKYQEDASTHEVEITSATADLVIKLESN